MTHAKTPSYVVKAACALIDVEGNAAVFVQHGGPVPSNATQGALDHLLSIDFIEEAESSGGLAPIGTGDGEKLLTAPKGAVDEPSNDDDGPDDVDGAGPIPPKSAPKDDWVAYAVSQGATEDEANAATKDDLIAAYGQVKS